MRRASLCALLWVALQGAQPSLEERARAIPDAARLRLYMERMAAEPHIAGSPQSKKVAEYAAGLLREWGFDVRIEEYRAVLPYAVSRNLELVSPNKFTAKLKESDTDGVPTYNSYSADGNVTAPLVYVNYGIPDDYDTLKKLGIDVQGKIVIARYGRSWRGTKAKVAQEHGAIGCIIYSDPRDDGYFNGDVYPKGPFRPPEGVQRGSVLDMPLFVGDPESRNGANVMKIPVLPISYADAEPLLAVLSGPVAPVEWRGALGLTYHIGPGPATVHLRVAHEWSPKPMHNVIATLAGREHPDEWVIYGNHHDAWVNGAADPISGASALLETARSLAELRKGGWQPKRTIKLALWDGEEFGLIGSTEWVEKHRSELLEKAVVYFNTDMNARGRLNAGGSPSLEKFFAGVLKDVRQPGESVSVLERREGAFRMNPVGAGSDYVAFLHHSGIPSVNTSFSSPGLDGVYHSIYDNIDWYTRFADPDFAHGKALAQVMTTAILRMADADVLPFTFEPVARAVAEWAKTINDAEITASIERLKKAAAAYDAAPSAAANRLLIRAERALIDEAGLPGRPWYKHQLMAPGRYTGYSAKVLPGVLDSMDGIAGRKALAAALNRYAEVIEQAAAAGR